MKIEDIAKQVLKLKEASGEVLKCWDGLGRYKDDDFGEVQEAMEFLRAVLRDIEEMVKGE